MMYLVSNSIGDPIGVDQPGQYLISGFVPLGSFPLLESTTTESLRRRLKEEPRSVSSIEFFKELACVL